MVRVIATDLDGTLLTPKKKFSLVARENKEYIKKFYGDTVLVSGRSPKFCAKVCNCLKIHHNFISLNGAIIVKNGNAIYKQSMKKTALVAMLDFLKLYYADFEFLIFDKYDRIICYTPISARKIKIKYLKHALKHIRLHDKIIVSNKKATKLLNNSTDIYKVIIYSKNCEDMNNLLKKQFNDHFSFFSTSHSIEISPIGVNKGEALQYLISTTKLKNNDVYVVGDSSNDIPMFDLFENSFVMASAENQTKLKARHVISKFTDLKKYTKINNNFKEEE